MVALVQESSVPLILEPEWQLPAVRQAESEDPVRRGVADTERETAIQKIAGHAAGCGGMAISVRTKDRRIEIYGNFG
jgi:hypothetical protein